MGAAGKTVALAVRTFMSLPEIRPPSSGGGIVGARRVAAIGLGKMGGPMALHLHEKGVLAAIFSPRTAKEFAAKNRLPDSIRLAASPKDAASVADTVLVSVPIHQVESVLFGGDGVAAGLGKGLVIESGNSDHRRDGEYESRFAAKGVEYLDAAVSGGPKRARAGTLVSIVGGKTETVEAARDVFAAFSTPPGGIFHVGPTGQGHEAKMYHNQDEQNDMRNIGEAISLLIASGMTFRDAFDALDKGDCRSALLTYAGTIPDGVLPRIQPTIGGGDLPQIAVETAKAIGHPTPLTRLTLDLRRWSRGEMIADELATRAMSEFAAKGVTHTLRLYNFLRERAWVQDVPEGDVGPVARVLALGYLLDLAEVVSIAQHRQINTRILAQVFRAGLCDKGALEPLLTQDLKSLKEFEPALPPEDRRVFEEGLAFAAKLGHPAPSAAAYLDLGNGATVARELKKLADPTARTRYGTAIRVQAGIRDAFGEHGYELAA